MSDLDQLWDEFQVRLGAFQSLACELKEELRGKMDQRIQAMNVEIEKFASRWHSLKPKTAADCSLEEAKRNCSKMQEWQEEWQSLKEQVLWRERCMKSAFRL